MRIEISRINLNIIENKKIGETWISLNGSGKREAE